MNLNVLQLSICLALLLVLTLLFIFGLNNLMLFCFRVKSCRRKDDINALINTEEWPMVTIQVATYNEGPIVNRLLESCLRLDYPEDKFEIIVVDDSTDETISILRDFERSHYPKVKVIHRAERSGYKAGALNEALKHSRGDYILILDADSVPKPDFLKKTIPLFLADENLGFVQGRLRYMNAEKSWLTKALALVNDWFATFLQQTLSKCGMMISFLGHGGIFRRRALENVGGWMSDTITEDMDVAYRVQLKGWKAIFFEEAESFEEVPPSYYSAVKRFKRHIKGPIQNLIKHAMPVIKHKESNFIRKFEALLQLAYPLVYPLGLSCIFLIVFMNLLIPGIFLDQFWYTALGFTCTLLMLLTFPYIAFVISPIQSILITAIMVLFIITFLLKSEVKLGKMDLGAVFGAVLIWNDNLINCLTPLAEIIRGIEGRWVPTERALSDRKSNSKDNKEKFKEGIMRITASIMILASFIIISCLNFSLNSLGIIIPAALWLYSAYLIMRD